VNSDLIQPWRSLFVYYILLGLSTQFNHLHNAIPFQHNLPKSFNMAPPSTKSPNIGLGILLPNYDDPAEDVLFNHPDIPLPLDSGGTLHTFGMSNRARSPNPGALYLHLRRERKRAIMSPTLVTSAAEFATQTPLLQAPSLLTPTISSPVSLAYGSPLLSTSRLTTPVVTSSPVFSSTHATQHAAPSSQVPTSSVNYVAITLALSMTLGVVVAVCTVGIAFLIWRRRKADSNRPHGGSSAKMGGGSKLSRVSDASLDGKMASKELNNQVALRSGMLSNPLSRILPYISACS